MKNEKRIEIIRKAHETMSLNEIGDVLHIGSSTIKAFLMGKEHTAGINIDERLLEKLNK